MQLLPRQPLLTAVCWDPQSVYYIQARSAGRNLCIQAAGAIDRSETSSNPISELLDFARRNNWQGKPRLLIGLGRSQVEVADLTLPPCRDEELPELVQNQTIHHLPELADEDTIDFVAHHHDTTQPRKVTAFVITADILEKLKRDDGKFAPAIECVSPRPLATVSLFNRIVGGSPGNVLVLSLLSNEVDFSIVCGSSVIYSRTTRLAENTSDEELADRLITEVNRTLIAAPHDVLGDDNTVKQVYLFGSRTEQDSIFELLQDELELPVSLIDPFAGTELNGTDLPRQAHCYAPLIGLLRDHVEGSHAVNFLNPKKPPRPRNQRRRIASYASLAAIVVVAGTFFLWDQVHSAKSANQELAQDRNALRKVLEKANSKKMVVDTVRQWQAADVNWLDELRDLSIRFPGTQDVVVQRLTVAPVAPEGGVVEMQVQVRDPEVLPDLENGLRDESHQINTEGALQRNEGSQYEWQSNVTLRVKRRSKEEYLAYFSTELEEQAKKESKATESLASRPSSTEEKQ